MQPFIGQIVETSFNFAPQGWALCNGQLLAISEYDALFSLLGTTYGGNGQTTFALPDLRGRMAIADVRGNLVVLDLATRTILLESSGAQSG